MTAMHAQSKRKPTWKIKLLYDGQCPLCIREVNFLLKKDAGRGIIKFVDIADRDYNPQENGNIDFETAMGRIHALTNGGTIIRNVEVFRRIYEELGIGWLYGVTKLPIVGSLADWLYCIWADWRLKLTGRPDLAIIVAEREQAAHQKTDRCRLDRLN
jgi:predicted DCC family thiol-disulfide oxidoreductase YuxK